MPSFKGLLNSPTDAAQCFTYPYPFRSDHQAFHLHPLRRQTSGICRRHPRAQLLFLLFGLLFCSSSGLART